MTNTGKEYEKFVEAIYKALTNDDRFTSVERDVNLEGKDGPRQIDILLRSEVAGLDLLTIIECKDHTNKRLDVTFVDGFDSVIKDVSASKGVLVSRYGFSKTAIRKAARVGITLCHASDVNSVLNEVRREVPIKAKKITIHHESSFTIRNSDPFIPCGPVDINEVVKELGIFGLVYRKMLNGEIKTPSTDQTIQLLSGKENLNHPMKDLEGNNAGVLEKYKIDLKFTLEYYYGHLSDIPDLTSMHQYDNDSTIFILKEEDYPNIIPSLKKFASEKDVPQNYKWTYNLLDFKFGNFLKESEIKKNPEQFIKVKHPRK